MSKPELKSAPLKPTTTPWESMSTADAQGAKDGRPVWLRGPGDIAVECFWRQSRKFSQGDGKWKPFSYWSRVIGPYTMLSFEPRGWYREDKSTK